MRQKSFWEILEERTITPLPSTPAYVEDLSPQRLAKERLELWLASHLEKIQIRHQPHRAHYAYHQYASSQVKEQSPSDSAHTHQAQPRPSQTSSTKRSLTPQECFALEFLRREGGNIEDNFEAKDLKRTYRILALRLHPDQHINASAKALANYTERFRQLVECIEVLYCSLR